jgi:hypothetical protein
MRRLYSTLFGLAALILPSTTSALQTTKPVPFESIMAEGETYSHADLRCLELNQRYERECRTRSSSCDRIAAEVYLLKVTWGGYDECFCKEECD